MGVFGPLATWGEDGLVSLSLSSQSRMPGKRGSSLVAVA